MKRIHDHLTSAQEIMDGLQPDSIFGARIQHLIDDLEQQQSQPTRYD